MLTLGHLYSDDSTSDIDYEDEVDYEAAARHAQMVKNRVEREEYLQVRYTLYVCMYMSKTLLLECSNIIMILI